MSIPETEGNNLVGRLAQIRRRLQKDPILNVGTRQERWVDVDLLLRLDGESFVRAAYHRLFGRQPDADGLRHHLDLLRTGRMTKPELLTALAQSSEGQECEVRFIGLGTASAHYPIDNIAGGTSEQFVRAVGRYYNNREPEDDSLSRWIELLDTGSLSRADVTRLFAASAEASQVSVLAGIVADIRQELDSHQHALEALRPRRR